MVHRRKRQDAWNEYTAQVVKMIMSKFEILQTGNFKQELAKINDQSEAMIYHNMNMATPTHWFYYSPSIFINAMKLGMFGFLGYQVLQGNFSVSFFVLLYGAMTLMNNAIINSMEFYNQFTNDFTKVEKMWDFFDTTPEIEGYTQGKTFEYMKGNITLKNVSFAYNEKSPVFDTLNLDIR